MAKPKINPEHNEIINRLDRIETKINNIFRLQQMYLRWQNGHLPNCATKPNVDGRELFLTEDEKQELNNLVYGRNIYKVTR